MEGTELVTMVNTKIVPLCIFFIMLGMGLTLVIDDFKRVVKFPKAASLGLTNQLILLPLIGFGLANIMPLEPEYAVGVMLLVVCPGGTTSNLFTHLGKGDVALSVSMTAVASVVTVASIPFILNFSLIHFMGEASELVLPIGKTMGGLMFLTIIPISLGMIIRHFAPKFADKSQVFVTRFGVIFIVALLAFLTYIQKDIVVDAFISVGPVSLLLNLSTMALGWFSAKWFQLNNAQRTSITIEVGLQNSTLSMFMALSLLSNYKMSFTPAVYTIIMLFTAGVLVSFMKYRFQEKVGNIAIHQAAKIIAGDIMNDEAHKLVAETRKETHPKK